MYHTLLDAKALTLLAVWEHGSFTRAAEALFITQPAVSQQMQALQEEVGHCLYTVVGRQVVLSEWGKQLASHLDVVRRETKRLELQLAAKDGPPPLRCGATRTIGEFTLPPIIARMLTVDGRCLSLVIDNTEDLLHKLDNGEIDCAWIEGAFDKRRYDYRLFSHERFIAIASPSFVASHPTIALEALLSERLLVREEGSGTRAVLEGLLADRGLEPGDFSALTVIGNLNVIKALVAEGMGISFMYEAAARDAIASNRVAQLAIEGWHVVREFNFVFPLHSREATFLLSVHERACANTAQQT